MPWHLNSLPRPPILPPHSGHTQFRMPETTSAVALTVLHLINTMHTSHNAELPAIANPVQAAKYRETLAHSASSQNVNRKTAECISSSKMRAKVGTRFKWAQMWFT